MDKNTWLIIYLTLLVQERYEMYCLNYANTITAEDLVPYAAKPTAIQNTDHGRFLDTFWMNFENLDPINQDK